MAETFTMNETPANPEVLNSDEQDSLAVAESLEQEQGQGEQQLLAGKFNLLKKQKKHLVKKSQALLCWMTCGNKLRQIITTKIL